MRHRNKKIRIGRKPSQARLELRTLATSVILYERVRTTKKRAQVVRPIVERIITIAKRTPRLDLAIRRIRPMLSDDNACRKVIEVMKIRYASRTSGFTRMTPIGMRKGDGAMLCEISLIDAAMPQVESSTTEKSKATSKPAATAKAPKTAKTTKKKVASSPSVTPTAS